VDRKKITAAFDGGRITSDAGVVLLGQAERRRGLAGKLAAVSADPRNPLLITADPALLGDYGDVAIPLGGSRLGGFGGYGGGSRRNESGARSATAR
jgi:Transposase DDE domain group 1